MARNPTPIASVTAAITRYMSAKTTVDMSRSLSWREHVRVEARSQCVRLVRIQVRDHFSSVVKNATSCSGLTATRSSSQWNATDAHDVWFWTCADGGMLLIQAMLGRLARSERSMLVLGMLKLSKYILLMRTTCVPRSNADTAIGHAASE